MKYSYDLRYCFSRLFDKVYQVLACHWPPTLPLQLPLQPSPSPRRPADRQTRRQWQSRHSVKISQQVLKQRNHRIGASFLFSALSIPLSGNISQEYVDDLPLATVRNYRLKDSLRISKDPLIQFNPNTATDLQSTSSLTTNRSQAVYYKRPVPITGSICAQCEVSSRCACKYGNTAASNGALKAS